MLILADNRIPQKAKNSLKKYGEVLLFEINGITYPVISGHPDIFFCKTQSGLVVAPNIPEKRKQQLLRNSIHIIEGATETGNDYPETARYNVVVTDSFLIHNLKHTDDVILGETKSLKNIHVNQAYTSCNLIALENNRFITSDKGIEKVLSGKGFEVLFVNPKGIILPGFKHGFIGGCCGISKERIFFTGSLNHFPEGDNIRNFIRGFEIIELYDGPLFDGGGLIIID